jgi:hypothetical protein
MQIFQRKEDGIYSTYYILWLGLVWERQTVMKQIHLYAAIEMPKSAVLGTHNKSPLI